VRADRLPPVIRQTLPFSENMADSGVDSAGAACSDIVDSVSGLFPAVLAGASAGQAGWDGGRGRDEVSPQRTLQRRIYIAARRGESRRRAGRTERGTATESCELQRSRAHHSQTRPCHAHGAWAERWCDAIGRTDASPDQCAAGAPDKRRRQRLFGWLVGWLVFARAASCHPHAPHRRCGRSADAAAAAALASGTGR